ncbi:hypothetical protein D9M68_799380 [compost metagenome]
MGVAFLFALGVVLAVNGNPFLGDHAGGQPQPETEEMHDGRMQIQTAVRLAAMEKDRDRHDRDVRHHQRENDDLPPSGLRQTAGNEGEDVIHKAVMSLA